MPHPTQRSAITVGYHWIISRRIPCQVGLGVSDISDSFLYPVFRIQKTYALTVTGQCTFYILSSWQVLRCKQFIPDIQPRQAERIELGKFFCFAYFLDIYLHTEMISGIQHSRAHLLITATGWHADQLNRYRPCRIIVHSPSKGYTHVWSRPPSGRPAPSFHRKRRRGGSPSLRAARFHRIRKSRRL